MGKRTPLRVAPVGAAAPVTGEFKSVFTSTDTLPGWLPCFGGTIGDAASGGTARANADCAALFTHLWEQTNDDYNPVSGGRGASAAADWAAHKTIGLPDARGRALVFNDPSGASGRLTDHPGGLGNGSTLGRTGGSDTHTLDAQELAVHNHNYTYPNFTTEMDNTGSSGAYAGIGASGTTDNAGNGLPHNNMMPSILCGILFIKL